jgi:chemotaxis protein MotB
VAAGSGNAAAELEECRTTSAANLAATQEAAANARLEMGREIAEGKREIEALKAREAELRARLEKEIREDTVEVERRPTEVSVRVVDHILFNSGSAEILKEGKVILDKVAGVLAASRDNVRVEGHSDDAPVSKRLQEKFTSNWELSATRAVNVVRYFQYAKGIEPARMEAVSLAQYRPSAPNDTFEGRRQNRRVVILLTTAPREQQGPRAPRAGQEASAPQPSK